MADLSYDDVRKIIGIIDASTLDEIHIEIGDFKLDVRRHAAGAPSSPQPARRPAYAPPSASSKPPAAAKPPVALSPGQFVLASPMLGTFYRSPAPDAPPFVDVGTVVAKDRPLCIIEVMKLMNTIKAERPGRVVAILAGNAALVESGETLIVFDPV